MGAVFVGVMETRELSFRERMPVQEAAGGGGGGGGNESS